MHVICFKLFLKQSFLLCATNSLKLVVKKFVCSSQGGMYVLQLFDFYGASGFTLLWTATWQCVAAAWLFGDQKMYDLIEYMIGYRPIAYFWITWKFAAPLLNIVSLLQCLLKFLHATMKHNCLKLDESQCTASCSS